MGEVGDFVVDLSRTWGVIAFRPWSAGRKLLEDRENDGGRYVGTSAFLVISSIVVAFLMGGGEDGDDSLAAMVKQGIEAAMNTAGGEADAAWHLAGALASGATAFVTARLAAWLGPSDRRGDVEALFLWCLSGVMFGLLPSVVFIVLLPDALWTVLVVVWLVFLAPAIALVRWVATQPIPLRRLRALGALVLTWGFAIVWIWSQSELADAHAELDADEIPVWYSPLSTEQKDDGWHIHGQFFNAGRKPWVQCTYTVCLKSDETPDCLPAQRTDEGRTWLPPDELVYANLRVTGDLPEGTYALCCDGDRERCLQGQ